MLFFRCLHYVKTNVFLECTLSFIKFQYNLPLLLYKRYDKIYAFFKTLTFYHFVL